MYIERNQGCARPIRYYRLIKGDRKGEAIFSEMENMISIIADHIKYIEAHQLRNMKASSDRSRTCSKPDNRDFWVINRP